MRNGYLAAFTLAGLDPGEGWLSSHHRPGMCQPSNVSAAPAIGITVAAKQYEQAQLKSS